MKVCNKLRISSSMIFTHDYIALEHPYLMSFALFVICAWPHILVLPVWFARDGARRMETHTRNFTTQVAAAPRRRRREQSLMH